MNNKRIVLTGANGFIGSNLIKTLLANGYNHLLAIDINEHTIDSVNLAVGSFSDKKFINELLQEDDIVIHLACTTVPALSEINPEKDRIENVIGTQNLLEVCVEKNISKFIFFSSGGTIYGDHGEKPIAETAKTNPTNSHGRMKLAIENNVHQFHQRKGLNYVILRPGNPYGRKKISEKNQGIIDIFLRKAINNEPLGIWGNGEIVRDYIYIDDLTGFVLKIIENDIRNETLNIGTGIGTSINELLGIIQKVVGKKLKINYLDNRGYDVPCNILSVEKGKKMLDWQPKTTIKNGIEMSYQKITKIKKMIMFLSKSILLLLQAINKVNRFLMTYSLAINNQINQDECNRFKDNLLLNKLKDKQPPGADRALEYPWMLANINIKEGRLLDVGSTACGLLYKLLPTAIEIHGINLNEQKKTENFKLKTGDIRKTDYPDNYFDVITCISTLEHIGVSGRYNSDDDPTGDQKATAEMRRILKPGGVLLTTVPYGKHDVLPINKLYNKKRIDNLFSGFTIERQKFMNYNKKFRFWLEVEEAEAAKTDMLRDGWYAITFIKAIKPEIKIQ